MKNIIVILALTMVLISSIVFAEVGAAATTVKETAETDCFLDEDGDGICDTCDNTAEECALIAGTGGCDTCTTCGEKNGE